MTNEDEYCRCASCNAMRPVSDLIEVLSNSGVVLVCAYCHDEQIIICEHDENRQNRGLSWVRKVLKGL